MEGSRALLLVRSALRSSQKLERLVHNVALTPAVRDRAYPQLGNRDIVGYGWNGIPGYIDRTEFPAPPVRFKENSKEILAVREKEKGDWKTLSLDDKKTLYRASFRMTFSEMNAPTGEWKYIIAVIFFGMSLSGWISIYLKEFVLGEVPHTITREWQEKQLELMIKQRQGRVTGISSHWDYEKNEWKK